MTNQKLLLLKFKNLQKNVKHNDKDYLTKIKMIKNLIKVKLWLFKN